jgi:predicted nucleotidyltransferase
MKRTVLQIPIDPRLREAAEQKAEKIGFSSLQEMVRVMLTQTLKQNEKMESFSDLCKNYGMKYLGVFGSVSRGDYGPDSDVDLVVKFDKSKKLGMFELARIQSELEEKFGRKVDLVTKMNKHVAPYANKDLKTIYAEK